MSSSGLYPTNSVTLETDRKANCCAHFIVKQQNSLSGTQDRVVLPALTVSEAKVHAVAAEEGVGIKRKLHTGRVRNGLAQQNHDPGIGR